MRTYNGLHRNFVLREGIAGALASVISLGLLMLAFAAPAGLGLVLAAELGGSQSGAPRVRTDGVYYLTMLDGSHRVVRFYDDGTAVEAGVSGDPARTRNWLSRDDPTILPGYWTMEGNELVFTRSTGFEETIRQGRLTEKGWAMDANETIVFKFAPVSFPKEAGAGKNRRPYFVGAGKGIRVFQYDAAGRRTGMDWQLEINAQDPDGDPVTITWKVSNGSVVGEGAKVLWQPTGPGTVTIVLTDGKGGRTESSTYLN